MEKGYLEKSGFWSIKIRIALCVYILIKNLISLLCIYKISIIDLILERVWFGQKILFLIFVI
jgi:hypothetical protein